MQMQLDAPPVQTLLWTKHTSSWQLHSHMAVNPQRDNAPWHSTKTAQEQVHKALTGPSNWPEPNLIEHLWDMLDLPYPNQNKTENWHQEEHQQRLEGSQHQWLKICGICSPLRIRTEQLHQNAVCWLQPSIQHNLTHEADWKTKHSGIEHKALQLDIGLSHKQNLSWSSHIN